MKKIMYVITVVCVILIALFLAAGCKGKIIERITEGAIESAIEAQSDGEVDIDVSEGGISIKTDEGEVTIGEGTDLPDGFPSIIPVYPDMTIQTAWKSTEDDKDNFYISALSDDSGEKIFNWYKDKMSGWEIESEFTQDSGEDGITMSINGNNGTYMLSILIFEDEGSSTIVENVGTK